MRIDVRRCHREVDILDENLVPDSFKIPQPAWIDYQKLSAALNRGITVPGAVLKEGEPSLNVRVI